MSMPYAECQISLTSLMSARANHFVVEGSGNEKGPAANRAAPTEDKVPPVQPQPRGFSQSSSSMSFIEYLM